ncbi:hypothetical protein [Deinococcus peraridilitoris]|uniref:Uncharacterized protein n=1 Tax=Deinococcus peraridilitoris (strain DSM 19664 / LMG 22246 / CIP 109416 / KR-200) TaxID=937777 RepID=L0A1K7_DEIPD|nr:hypothetical protein [Deinococcus peraridilitoris]AFZ67334.1 hypothetical protein Deipe_1818 [Deinococcus peraridilitoris DSM 19664]
MSVPRSCDSIRILLEALGRELEALEAVAPSLPQSSVCDEIQQTLLDSYARLSNLRNEAFMQLGWRSRTMHLPERSYRSDTDGSEHSSN